MRVRAYWYTGNGVLGEDVWILAHRYWNWGRFWQCHSFDIGPITITVEWSDRR